MAYDPNFPPTNADLISSEFRTQFQGLAALIAAIQSITSAQVGSVTTGNPGDPATVGVSVVGGTLFLTFSIPRGDVGATGEQGPPFAQCVVDGVTTLDPGEPATVDVTFDATVVHFTFAIPRGSDGAAGEVTTAQLDTAIGGTSSNTNSVGTIDTPFGNDPATQADMEFMRAKFNELVLAGRR